MPLPIILIPLVVAKGAAIAKAAMVAGKGAVIITKAAGGKAVVAKAATAAAHTYGWGNVIAFSTVASLTVGAAALILDRARDLKIAIEERDPSGSVIAARRLLSEISGLGGLDSASQLLHDFISVGGNDLELARRISLMLDELIKHLKRRID